MTADLDPAARAIELIRDGRLPVDRPLTQWLLGHGIAVAEIAIDDLIDLACVDLMCRRRAGFPATCESYIEDLRALQSETHLLDLIDAEICVASELGQPASRADLHARFPSLRCQIDGLLDLGPLALDRGGQTPNWQMAARPDPGRPQKMRPDEPTVVDDGTSDSGEFSAADSLIPGGPQPSDANTPAADLLGRGNTQERFNLRLPIELPNWFRPELKIAASPGRWLIRGRDADRGTLLALKIIELPVDVSKPRSTELLDRCEAAAKVRHPCWMAPVLATVHDRYFAVIRPWVHAPGADASFTGAPTETPHETASGMRHAQSVGDQVGGATPAASQLEMARRLAALAYAIQAAHTAGATHGSIRPANVLVDHRGATVLVDSVANQATVGDASIHAADGDLRHRIRRDVDDLVQLVVTGFGEDVRVSPLTCRIREIAEFDSDSADERGGPPGVDASSDSVEKCGAIGETLLRFADGMLASDRPPGRSRLHRLIGRWKS